MRYVYARCMDQHFYRVTDSALCPVDGSSAGAAVEALPVVNRLQGQITLADLVAAGVTAEALADTLIIEVGQEPPVLQLLRPWYEGERQARGDQW